MSIISLGGAYMALVYESCCAFLTMHHLIHFVKAMKFELVDIMIVFVEMVKVLGFSMLTVGLICRWRIMLKLWLLSSCLHIKWNALVNLCISIYGYLVEEKFSSVGEFAEHLNVEIVSPLVQMLIQVAIIWLVYRYYKSLDTPKNKERLIEIKLK